VNTLALQVVAAARVQLDPFHRWTQEVGARDRAGEPVPTASPLACCWCLTGALRAAAARAVAWERGIVDPNVLVPSSHALYREAIKLVADTLRQPPWSVNFHREASAVDPEIRLVFVNDDTYGNRAPAISHGVVLGLLDHTLRLGSEAA
jgi:hypothetical protein